MIGYWDNQQVEVVGVTYTVTKSPQPLHWQNHYAGKKRQGLKIKQKAFEFIIDNEHGDGYLKLTEGRGSFMYGHKSVVDPISVIEIPDDQINTKYDTEALEAESYARDKWMAENHPKEFKRLLELRQGAKELREQTEKMQKGENK